MVTRVITKALAGAQDILFGRGTTAQIREGVSYNIERVEVIKIVDTMADLLALDVSDVDVMFYNVMLMGFTVLGDGGGGMFWYDSSEPQTNHNGKTIIKATGASVTGCYKKVLPDEDTQVNFLDLSATVNTTNKYEGKQMWDNTNLQPLWAKGPAAGDLWVDGTGATVHTPV